MEGRKQLYCDHRRRNSCQRPSLIPVFCVVSVGRRLSELNDAVVVAVGNKWAERHCDRLDTINNNQLIIVHVHNVNDHDDDHETGFASGFAS
jgi:hypothetical protein